MSPVIAFTIVMFIWTVSDFVSKITKSLLSSLFVASIIFLIGFKTNIFPADLLESSSLLTLGHTVLGFIIVHIGTMISIDDLKKQWRTVLIGIGAVAGIALALFFIGPFFKDMNYVIAAIGAVSGGSISIIIVQGCCKCFRTTFSSSFSSFNFSVAGNNWFSINFNNFEKRS